MATYWKCTAGHNHQTPAAASRCSAQQPDQQRQAAQAKLLLFAILAVVSVLLVWLGYATGYFH
jgi:hypothetical protein